MPKIPDDDLAALHKAIMDRGARLPPADPGGAQGRRRRDGCLSGGVAERHQVAHNDGTKDNNRADNLRWALPEENQADRIVHGTDIRGEDVHGAILRDADIPVIRRLRMQHVPLNVIARAYGVSESTVSLVALGKIWRHAA